MRFKRQSFVKESWQWKELPLANYASFQLCGKKKRGHHFQSAEIDNSTWKIAILKDMNKTKRLREHSINIYRPSLGVFNQNGLPTHL